MKNKLANINHEHIYNFVASHTIDEIIYIEHQDAQFLSINNLVQKILGIWSTSNWSKDIYNANDNKSENSSNIKKIILIDLIIKISLISYQIWWTGEQRWIEVCDYIYHEWSDLLSQPNLANSTERRKKLLQTCKYNRRLINMKISRLSKIGNLRDIFPDLASYEEWYNDMNIFHQKICNKLWADIYAKTPLFATKMFGYIGRIIFEISSDTYIHPKTKQNQIYPSNLSIPLDSRLKQIYISIHWPLDSKNPKYQNEHIIWYFDKLWNDHGISPLHLDSLLWLKYRDEINI